MTDRQDKFVSPLHSLPFFCLEWKQRWKGNIGIIMDLRKPLLHFLSKFTSFQPPNTMMEVEYDEARTDVHGSGRQCRDVVDASPGASQPHLGMSWGCCCSAVPPCVPCVPRKAYPVLNLDPAAEQLPLYNTYPYRLQLILGTVAYRPATLQMCRRPG